MAVIRRSEMETTAREAPGIGGTGTGSGKPVGLDGVGEGATGGNP
jgi:hypothetical protein